MPTTYNLRASNNATFCWTRDLTPFASVYNIAAATLRMQARSSPYAHGPPTYQWLSTASADGQIVFNPTTNLCVFVAPEADMARMRGDLVYDCRLEFSGGASIVIFGGRLSFSAGVTRLASDLSGTGVAGLGDTVSVEGERGISPVPLPLSLSAAVAACQASQAAATSAAASMTTAIAEAVASLNIGSASQQSASAFDAAGAAAAAQGNAEASAASALAAATAPAALVAALAGLSSPQLAALATALLAAAPASALSASIGAMIQTLPTDSIASCQTLWNNGGVLQYS